MAISFSGSDYLLKTVSPGYSGKTTALSFWFYHDGTLPDTGECIFARSPGRAAFNDELIATYLTSSGAFEGRYFTLTTESSPSTSANMISIGWYHVFVWHQGFTNGFHFIYLNGGSKGSAAHSGAVSHCGVTTIGVRRIPQGGFPATFDFVDHLARGKVAEVCEWFPAPDTSTITSAQVDAYALALYRSRLPAYQSGVILEKGSKWRYWPFYGKQFTSIGGFPTTLAETGTVSKEEDHPPMGVIYPHRWFQPVTAPPPTGGPGVIYRGMIDAA